MSGASGLPPWDDLISGKNCPLCEPYAEGNAYNFKIADLSVSGLYLERDQTYRGYCVMKFQARHVTGIEHLSADEYTAFMNDLRQSARAIAAVVKPDHMNYATLGNVIPHLHYHIIPRYQGDLRWGAPVWLTSLADMPKTKVSDAEYAELVAAIRAALV